MIPSLAKALDEPLVIPPGFGFRALPAPEWRALDSLMGHLLVWEPPRKDQLYVLSADVGDGLGLDRSCVDITRVGTIREGEEQVAQYVSDEIDPIDLAIVIDAIGRLYTGQDTAPALCAVEINNHGLATQSELERHLGYDNFFIWQYEDAADPKRRFSSRVGWLTTQRTRPLILARYVKRVKAVDPNTGLPDYRINSPFTLEELKDFVVPPGGLLWQAEADPTAEDAHDDCIMSGAIGVHVAQTLQFEDREPVAETRRRLSEQKRRQEHEAERMGDRRDWRNTDATEQDQRLSASEEEAEDWYA